MDIRMPVVDGLEATRRLGGRRHLARILILTTFDLNEYVYEALRAGASGFLLKDDPAEKLIKAVRVVAAGEALLAPSVARRVIEHFAALPRPRAELAAALGELTARESWRSCGWWPAGCRTPRSPPRSSSASTRPRPTSGSALQARTPRPHPSGRLRVRVGPGACRARAPHDRDVACLTPVDRYDVSVAIG